MEKMAVIRPDVTPTLAEESNVKIAANDCTESNIVDNCKVKVVALDSDFRKQAAAQVTKKLDS